MPKDLICCYESVAVRALDAALQPHGGTTKAMTMRSAPRLFPRFRETPTRKQECDRIFCRTIKAERWKLNWIIASQPSYLVFFATVARRVEEPVVWLDTVMYRRGCELLLAIFLGTAGTLADWKLILHGPCGLAHIADVWAAVGNLQSRERSRARENIIGDLGDKG